MAGGGLRVDVSRDEGDEHAEGTAQPKARFSGGSPSGESSLVQQRFPSSKMKVDELFIQWLSLPESQKLVMSLLEDAKAGRPLIAPGGPNSHSASGSLSPLSPTSASSLFGATPPLSPRSDKPMSPKSPLRRQASGLSHAGSPVKPHANRSFEAIPQFYFPNGPPATEDVAKQCMVKIHQFFHEHPEGLNAEEREDVAKQCMLKNHQFFHEHPEGLNVEGEYAGSRGDAEELGGGMAGQREGVQEVGGG
ncbi:unnamed protein product [Closterium sp. NIES-53]